LSRIILMPGHWHIEGNEDPARHGWTGAPDEQTFNVSCAVQIGDILALEGHEVVVTDANYHVEIYGQDADAFLTIHYDSYGETKPRGCRMCRPRDDHAWEASDRLVDLLLEEYPERTGIPLFRNNQLTAGMEWNYAFGYPTKPTPCAIIECGVGYHPEDRALLCHDDGTCRPEIAAVIAACLVAFVAGENPEPVDVGPTDYAKMLNRQEAVEWAIQKKRSELWHMRQLLHNAGLYPVPTTLSGEWKAYEDAYHRVINGEADMIEWER